MCAFMVGYTLRDISDNFNIRDLSVHGLNGVGKLSWVDMAEKVIRKGVGLPIGKGFEGSSPSINSKSYGFETLNQKDKLRSDSPL